MLLSSILPRLALDDTDIASDVIQRQPQEVGAFVQRMPPSGGGLHLAPRAIVCRFPTRASKF